MKTLPFFASLALAGLPLPLAAQSDASALERRCAEQERQIHQLELENSRLRSLLTTAETTSTPVAQQAPAPGASAPASEPAATERLHTVSAGETLSKIARRYDTTTRQLVELNGLKDAGLIHPGQRLKLPAASAPAPEEIPAPAAAPSTHKVRAGETFFSIARQHGLSPNVLAGANPGVNPRSLRVGQVLNLAPSTETPAAAEKKPVATSEPVINKPLVRTVRIDEETTFADFATQHGTETAKLNALNGLDLEPNTVLAKGSELYVSAQP